MPNPTNYDGAHIRGIRSAVILAGGGSRRMGTDKGGLRVDGRTVLERTLAELAAAGWPALVLGGSAPTGADHRPDPFPGEGPLRNLFGLQVKADWTFVISCDVPRFDGRVPSSLLDMCGDHDAAVPVVGGRSQPLCALYSRRAFEKLSEVGCERRVQAWLDLLDVRHVDESELVQAGLAPWNVQGANTPEEFAWLLAQG